MENLTREINAINQQLADNTIYTEANKQKLQRLLVEKSDLEKAHDEAELEWLDSNEQLEQLLAIM
jgi:ATP-binding cassette subfamily F protein 3